MPAKLLLFIVIALLPQLAVSQIYKCENSNSKITYSEEPCPSGTKGESIYLEPNTIESSELRRQIEAQEIYAPTSYQAKTTRNAESPDNLMFKYNKKNRVRALQIDINTNNSYYEKIADAKNELSYLRKNPVYSLSIDDELKRRNLKVDLQSPNDLKRSNALHLLFALYVKYQFP